MPRKSIQKKIEYREGKIASLLLLRDEIYRTIKDRGSFWETEFAIRDMGEINKKISNYEKQIFDLKKEKDVQNKVQQDH